VFPQTRDLLLKAASYVVLLLLVFYVSYTSLWGVSGLLLSVLPALLFLSFLLSQVAYEPGTMKRISLASLGCPSEVEELMKDHTRDGDPINRIIIGLISREVSLSQAGVHKALQDEEIELSTTTVNNYLEVLCTHDLLSVEPPEKKKGVEKSYQLTPKGEWFLKASEFAFPRTNFEYLLRYVFSAGELQPFPDGHARGEQILQTTD